MADLQQPGRSLPEVPLLSQMTQEGAHPGNGDPPNGAQPTVASSDSERRRPWSSQGIKAILSPSPTFTEPRRLSKDDHDVDTSPVTPKRPGFANRLSQGLSLQMPPRDISSNSTANLTTRRIPLSPKPESSPTFTSPTSILPRRSRGMDFSRAATNLHHSTLAEQSSPESSPTVGGRRGVPIPPRKSFHGPYNGLSITDVSNNLIANSLWTTLPGTERSNLSSSLASSSMMDDDSGGSSSDQDEIMDYGEDEDTIHTVPQINGMGVTHAFGSSLYDVSNSSNDATGAFCATAAKLLSYQRHRVQSRRSRARNNSSSAGGQSLPYSSGPNSPPLIRTMDMTAGFFLNEPAKKEIQSRRQSLSLGTNNMQLSDAEQSEDESTLQSNPHEEAPAPNPVTPSMEERKEVVRRAVTRRSNLLPKSKNFARIRATLLEEGAPVDTEVRREAEVIRQVRESESDADRDLNLQASQPTTSVSSPNLGPLNSAASDNAGIPLEDTCLDSEDSSTRRSSSAFSTQAIKNSGGLNFWNNFDERMRTPPPSAVPRSNSSGISEDMNMETPQSSVLSVTPQQSVSKHEDGVSANQIAAITRKGNKRMREDDLDPNYFKRRAVSPGLSVQNSPILPQSPGWWGTQARTNRETPSVSVPGERTGSNSSAGVMSTNCTPKRVGLQGMNDTNDGLMNMSIE